MRADLHVHSEHSGDNRQTVETIIHVCRDRGIKVVAVADHNSLSGTFQAMRIASDDTIVVPAIEITTEEGHVLAYNVTEEVPRDLSVAETIDIIRSQGGIAVAPHPFRRRTGLGAAVVMVNRFDAIEGMNARSTAKGNAKAVELANSLHLPMTGGSDAHRPENVGRGVTIVADDCIDADGVLKCVLEHRSSVEGKSRGRRQSIGYATKVVGGWTRRGFRRI
jgi:predicted metal-dependent phosphoesterase TrpH